MLRGLKPKPNAVIYLVAEWIHFTLFGIILPVIAHYQTKSVHFLGLVNSATKVI